LKTLRGNRLTAAPLAAFVLALMTLFATSGAAALNLNAKAPDFETKQLTEPGGSFKLSRQLGKVVYVDFWASWCTPCRYSFPILDGLADKYGAQGFMVVGVNQDDSVKDREAFRQKVPVKFALLDDGDHDVAKAFDVKAMPCGYLIDRKGILRRIHLGFDASTPEKLEAEIQLLLKEVP